MTSTARESYADAQPVGFSSGRPVSRTPESHMLQSRMPWKRTLSDMGKGILFFVLLGPPLGGLSLTLTMLVLELAQGARIQADDLLVLLLIPIIAYPFGAIPAALTGLVLGAIRDRLRGWRGAVLGGAVGYLVTLGLLQLLEAGRALDASLFGFAATGLFAAAVLAPVFAKRWSERVNRARDTGAANGNAEPDATTASPHA
jgi:hypothetical protein